MLSPFSETRRADRAQIVDALNGLALEALGTSFNELCGLAREAEVLALAPPTGPKYQTQIGQALGTVIGDLAQVQQTFVTGPVHIHWTATTAPTRPEFRRYLRMLAVVAAPVVGRTMLQPSSESTRKAKPRFWL